MELHDPMLRFSLLIAISIVTLLAWSWRVPTAAADRVTIVAFQTYQCASGAVEKYFYNVNPKPGCVSFRGLGLIRSVGMRGLLPNYLTCARAVAYYSTPGTQPLYSCWPEQIKSSYSVLNEENICVGYGNNPIRDYTFDTAGYDQWILFEPPVYRPVGALCSIGVSGRFPKAEGGSETEGVDKRNQSLRAGNSSAAHGRHDLDVIAGQSSGSRSKGRCKGPDAVGRPSANPRGRWILEARPERVREVVAQLDAMEEGDAKDEWFVKQGAAFHAEDVNDDHVKFSDARHGNSNDKADSNSHYLI